MIKNPKITIKELAETLKLTPKGIEWNLKNMKNKNQIRRVGSTKAGYWEVIKK